MGWATHAVKALQEGKSVQIRPRGDSMTGKANSRDLVAVELAANRDLQSVDIVLSKARCNEYLHLIKAIKGNQYQIDNNRGGINGWIISRNIFGIAAKVEKWLNLLKSDDSRPANYSIAHPARSHHRARNEYAEAYRIIASAHSVWRNFDSLFKTASQ